MCNRNVAVGRYSLRSSEYERFQFVKCDVICYHPGVTLSWPADYGLLEHIQQFMQGLVILKTQSF